jgi:hypothetical protein
MTPIPDDPMQNGPNSGGNLNSAGKLKLRAEAAFQRAIPKKFHAELFYTSVIL